MALVCAGLCSGPLDDVCTSTGVCQQRCSQPPRHSAERAAPAPSADTNCAQASRGLMRAQRQGPRRLGLKLRQPPTATVTIVPPTATVTIVPPSDFGGVCADGVERGRLCEGGSHARSRLFALHPPDDGLVGVRALPIPEGAHSGAYLHEAAAALYRRRPGFPRECRLHVVHHVHAYTIPKPLTLNPKLRHTCHSTLAPRAYT
jgi:hypothetical protein